MDKNDVRYEPPLPMILRAEINSSLLTALIHTHPKPDALMTAWAQELVRLNDLPNQVLHPLAAGHNLRLKYREVLTEITRSIDEAAARREADEMRGKTFVPTQMRP